MVCNDIQETDVQSKIIDHIDGGKSFLFNAGAGAGKTYALVETIKYVTINKFSETKYIYKVACITYTNVAVNEIKKRLGNSSVVHVSTIHEMLWLLIKKYQPQLLECHKKKTEEVLEFCGDQLRNDSKSEFYRNLSTTDRRYFDDYIVGTKELFYRSKNLKADAFKKNYSDYNEIIKPSFFDKCIKNVKNFKFVVDLIYKRQSLEECLCKIKNKEVSRVNYDSKVNRDRLSYMKFSHDTLLEYSLSLFKGYPFLCRMVIDIYPYFFIDEYQDTDIKVISIIKVIHDYAIGQNKNWMVGYFGDVAQSIYEGAVGKGINEVHGGLCLIDKFINRRSHSQIIDVANKIRNDAIVQRPISELKNNGSVLFFNHDNEKDQVEITKNFLVDYKKSLDENDSLTSNNEKIHCLVLTNQLIAKLNNFGSVYNAFKRSSIFYEELNAQVLSKQLKNLHPTVLVIYRLAKIYKDISEGVVSYYSIFGDSVNFITFSRARFVIRELKDVMISTFGNWIDFLSDRLENSKEKDVLGEILKNRVGYDGLALGVAGGVRLSLLDSIDKLMNGKGGGNSNSNENIELILSLPMKDLINWIGFIDDVEVNDIIYHTYHGVKGKEYKNVAVIMENDFGNEKGKFKNYFHNIKNTQDKQVDILSDPSSAKPHIHTKNLLYVACSRAILNLRILYLGDISDIKEGIESIFGSVEKY